MSSISRKDSKQIIAENNNTMKRVNFMNTPYSVQSTGADKIEGKVIEVTTETLFNALSTRQRVLMGNKEGHIKTITESTSLVITTYDLEKNEINTTYTMAQVLSSGNLFFLDEDNTIEEEEDVEDVEEGL